MPAAAVDRSVERVLAAFGLQPDRIEAIGAGNVNDSWDVTASSMRWILRRYSTARLPAGIPFEHAVLVIDWPLTHPARVAITAPIPQGFTRRDLVKAICEEYENVYEAEEGTAHTKPTSLGERGVGEQRNRTDGVYGIWGHDLADLRVTALRWTRLPQGNVEIELHVDAVPRPN